jgi:hypothetical protein
MLALSNDKRPVVMARVRELGEHVDDHQLELAQRLSDAGLVQVVEDARSLETALAGRAEPPAGPGDAPWLGIALRDYLTELLDTPVGAGAR